MQYQCCTGYVHGILVVQILCGTFKVCHQQDAKAYMEHVELLTAIQNVPLFYILHQSRLGGLQ